MKVKPISLVESGIVPVRCSCPAHAVLGEVTDNGMVFTIRRPRHHCASPVTGFAPKRGEGYVSLGSCRQCQADAVVVSRADAARAARSPVWLLGAT